MVKNYTNFNKEINYFFKGVVLCLTFLYGITKGYSQSETEPNNTIDESGVQYIYQQTTLAGTVSNNDVDYWRISRANFENTTKFVNYTLTGNNVKLEKIRYLGGDWGAGPVNPLTDEATNLSFCYACPPIAGAGNGTNWYYALRITSTSTTPQSYSVNLSDGLRNGIYYNDFPLCPTPNQSGNITVTPGNLSTPNSVTLNSFNAVSGASGYIVTVSTSSITSEFNNGRENLPTANTVWEGSGEQVVYVGTSNTPNIDITNLTLASSYYFRVYTYTVCHGYYVYENAPASKVETIVNTCNTTPPNAPRGTVFNEITPRRAKIASINAPLGAPTANGYVVKINTENNFTTPSNGTIPIGNTSYTTGEQVVYSGNATNPNVIVSDLAANTTYYFKTYAYTNSCGGIFSTTGIEGSFTTASLPGVPSNLILGEVNNTFIDVNSFTAATNASGYVIAINTSNTFTVPTDGASLPIASTNYGGGTQVIYSGTSINPGIRVTGLTVNTTYYFKVYAYVTSNGVNYFEDIGATASSSVCAIPVNNQITLISNNSKKTETSVEIQQTKPVALDGVIVYINDTNSFTAPTTNNTLPIANPSYVGSGQQVITSSTSTTSSVEVTNLNANTTYYFKAYGYNTCVNGNFYFEELGTSHSDTTCGITTNLASNVVVSNIKLNSLSIDSFNAPTTDIHGNDPTGYAIVMNTTNSFTAIPKTNSLPSANTMYLGGEQVIYIGNETSPSLNITKLRENTEYYFTIYAYQLCDTNYHFQQTGYSFSQKTEAVTANLVSNVVASNVVRNSLEVSSFSPSVTDVSAVDINGYVLVMNTTNSFTALGNTSSLPAANTTYSNGEQIVYAGNSSTPNLSITGLTENTNYYFTIYGYALQNGTYNYQSIGYTFTQSTLHISFTNPSLAFEGADVTLDGTTSSGGIVSYSLVNDTTGSSINGNIFDIGNPGNTTVRVSTTANGVYGSDFKDFPVTITNLNPVITWNTPPNIDQGVPLDGTYLNAIADVPGTFEYYKNYNAFNNTFSQRITSGVTTLTISGANTIYTRFIPTDTNSNIAIKSVVINMNTDAAVTVLEITPQDIIKKIGAGDPSLTYNITNGKLATDDKIWVPLKREPGETEGTYIISIDETAQAPSSFDFAGICPTGVCIIEELRGEDEFILKNGDYTIQLQTGTFTVTNKEEVTITLSPLGFLFPTTYNGTPRTVIVASNITVTATGNSASPAPVLNYIYSGNDFVGNSYGPSVTPPTNAGSYTIKAMIDVTDPNFYGAKSLNFDIVQNTLTITPDTPQIKMFDGAPKIFEATATGVLGENVPLLIRYDIDPSIRTTYDEAVPVQVGTYPVFITAENSNNYNISYNGSLTITDKKEVIINLTNLTQTYGASPKPVTIASIEESVGITATPIPNVNITYKGINGTSYATSSIAPTLEGEYRVTATVDSADPIFFGRTNAVLTIVDKTSQAIIFDTLAEVTYGVADFNLTATSDSGLPITYISSDTSVATISGNTVTVVGAGSTTITASQAGNGTYNPAIDVNQTLVVNKNTIEVTADARNKVYGEADPTLTYQITSGSLAGSDAFTGGLERITGDNVGNYTINQGTLALNENYDVTYVGNNLTITKRVITVTADARNKVYGEVDPTLTYQITSGSLAGSDAFTGSLEREVGESVGNYTINQGTLILNTNYTLTYIGNTLAITKRAITVTADPKQKIYGNVDPALTYQITSGSLVGSDAFTGSITREAGENVIHSRNGVLANTYNINQGTLALNSNYDLSFIEGRFSISGRNVNIFFDNMTKTYGEADPIPTYTFIHGTSMAYDDTLIITRANRAAGENVGIYRYNGSHEIEISSTHSTNLRNYYINIRSNTIATLTITKRPIEVTADAVGKVYGEPDPALTYQITSGSLANGDTFTGELEREAGENVINDGTNTPFYAINQGNLALNTNYDFSFVGARLRMSVRYVNFSLENVNKVYGEADPLPSWSIVDGTTTAFGDTIELKDVRRIAGENVGTYIYGNYIANVVGNFEFEITSTQSTDPRNYVFNFRSYGNPGLTITKKVITVTADAKTKIYGAADPTFTYQVTSGNLVGSDAFTGSIERQAGQAAGNYAINQGTLALNNNYDLSFVPGNLYIDFRFLRIVPSPIQKTYGEADPNFNTVPFTITEGSLAFDDTVSLDATWRQPGENVGSYTIGDIEAYFISTVGGENSYAVTFTNPGEAKLIINKRPIEVTAVAQNKIYGDIDPTLTYQITTGNLVGSDVLMGNLSRTTGEIVGSYTISLGTLENNNYAISFIPNNLTISKRPIEVTADKKSKVYGEVDPVFTYQITSGSLVGSDVFTGSLVRVSGENVGTYAINQSSLGLNSNYTLSYISNDLTITKKAITVTADAKTKIYGAADPVFTYQVTSGNLVRSDAFTGNIERQTGQAVGNYAINQGTLALNNNYDLNFVSGNLYIDFRFLRIVPSPIQKTYGEADPNFNTVSFTITEGSLAFDDMVSLDATWRQPGENVGSYEIGDLEAYFTSTHGGENSYAVTFTNPGEAKLIINKRPIEVTANSETKEVGQSDPVLTYQITVGNLVGSDAFVGSLERVVGEAVGDYLITQGTLVLDANYSLSFVGNTFRIIPASNQSIWNGSSSSVWNEETNWNGNVAPPTNHDVLIPNVGTTPEVTSGITAEMNNLTVEASSSVRIAEDGGAIVAGNFDNSGAVVITSTVATSGALIVKGTANGMVSYERGGLLANKWSIITAPVSGQSIKDFVDNVANNIRRNTTVTPNRVAVGYYDDSQPAGSKWVYYTTTDLASNSVTFEKGRSYIISRATDGAVTFTGTIETNDVIKNVAASEWNAIGNPYTAYVPVNENGGDNFIQDNIASFDPIYMGVYVWDTTQNKYVANSLVTGAKSIVPGQGFFVRTTTGVTNMNFKESLRSVQNVGGAFNRGIEPTTSIELIVDSANRTVNTTITFRQEASLGLDPGYDLGNFDGANFDVFTRLVESDKKQNFAYQSLPEEALETQIIPIGIKSKAGANLIFTAENTNLPEGISVYLEDKLLNKFIELDATRGTSYTIQLDEKINGIGRFYLHTKSSTLTIPTFNINDLKIYNRNLELVVEGIQGKNFEMNVYNTVGAKVFEGSYEGTGTNLIDLPAMEVGVYIVRIITEFGIKEKKIIIKK